MRNDRSFIELRARERAHALLDDGSYRELLDPFDGIVAVARRPGHCPAIR